MREIDDYGMIIDFDLCRYSFATYRFCCYYRGKIYEFYYLKPLVDFINSHDFDNAILIDKHPVLRQLKQYVPYKILENIDIDKFCLLTRTDLERIELY